jgi:hypothetical protein
MVVLITQRSVVQIHPPQPTSTVWFLMGCANLMNWLGDSNPTSQPKFQEFFTHSFTQALAGTLISRVSVPRAHPFTTADPRSKPISIFCRPALIAASIADSCVGNVSDAIRVELAVILMFPLVVCFPYLLSVVRRLNRSERKQSLGVTFGKRIAKASGCTHKVPFVVAELQACLAI